MGQKHKYAELIHAWADGAEVEYFWDDQWRTVEKPQWLEDMEYRLKPVAKEIPWYEQIPEQGILCKCTEYPLSAPQVNIITYIRLVKSIINSPTGEVYFRDDSKYLWGYAEPVTGFEIQGFRKSVWFS